MKQKSVNDRYNYAVNQMEKAYECFPFHLSIKRGRKEIDNECLRIFFASEYKDTISPDKIDLYLSDLIHELEIFDIASEPYKNILEKFRRPSNFRQENTYDKFDKNSPYEYQQ